MPNNSDFLLQLLVYLVSSLRLLRFKVRAYGFHEQTLERGLRVLSWSSLVNVIIMACELVQFVVGMHRRQESL